MDETNGTGKITGDESANGRLTAKIRRQFCESCRAAAICAQ